MSDNDEKPEPENAVPEPPVPSDSSDARHADVPEDKPEAQSNHANDAVEYTANGDDPTAELKRSLGENRLPPDVKAQILAELPPLAEQERMYRELMEKGGLSFEECFESLFREFEPQP
jgi:hypothetical protein